jgi:hypothetical protein
MVVSPAELETKNDCTGEDSNNLPVLPQGSLRQITEYINNRSMISQITINFWMPKPIFMKVGIYIMVPDPISTAYFINPSHQSMCMCI